MKYSDLEDAFMYVSLGPMFQNSAVVHRTTGEAHYWSENSEDLDDDDEGRGAEERFDRLCEDENYVFIPHKNDLELGKRLVFDFISRYLPDDYEEVRLMLVGRGAYARYKYFLERRDMLEAWYAFEAERTEAALREWAADNGIELSD